MGMVDHKNEYLKAYFLLGLENVNRVEEYISKNEGKTIEEYMEVLKDQIREEEFSSLAEYDAFYKGLQLGCGFSEVGILFEEDNSVKLEWWN